MFKSKISVIGAGFVGSTTAYTLVLSGLVSEMVIVDINREKAEGDAMDINHGLSFLPSVKIIAGSYEDTKDSDVIVITAGANQKPGETRVGLLKRNTGIFKDILDQLLPYCKKETVFLVVTNPVDILTYVTLKISNHSPKKIIGSGTVLDTARLKYLIGELASIDVRNVHTYIVGEHGDTETAAWSLTSIAGMSLEEFYVQNNIPLHSIQQQEEMMYEKTKNAAYEIIDKKGATYYAIALAVRRIIESIIRNENSILTVSSFLQGEYGIKDICLSIPTIVNHEGIDKILEVPLSPKEKENLCHSAETLKNLAKEIGL